MKLTSQIFGDLFYRLATEHGLMLILRLRRSESIMIRVFELGRWLVREGV